MIDIHSHILFGVDDGPLTIEDSIKMVYEAEEAGVKVIVATPHYGKFLIYSDKIRENYNELLYRTRGSGVTIKLGYEVMLNPCILKKENDKNKLSLDGSNYLLFEFPYGSLPVYSHDTIYKLQLEGIVPIIAHPERNINFLKNIDLLTDFLDKGCLAQVDAGSIAGVYGEKVRNFSKKLIISDLVHFVASDAHSPGGYTDWYVKAYGKIAKWVGEHVAEMLFIQNPKVILNKSREDTSSVI